MAKKPKLTHRQKRQVASNRQRKMAAQHAKQIDIDSTTPIQTGRVIGRFGKHADVEQNLKITRCHIRRTIDSVVCGDIVQFRTQTDSQEKVSGIIETVNERKTVLTRPDFYDGIKPIASNIDRVAVISSVLPEFSPHIIDRYLVACEDIGIKPFIVVNKIELAEQNAREDILLTLSKYNELGYETLVTSCENGEGIQDLTTLLRDNISVFVGQSGVGKSSLINQILPQAGELTGEVSSTSGLGQHTTTAAKLLHLPEGGDLIDSPGVREFGLWHLTEDQVTWGFIEFRDYIGGCKFSDCKHANDPGCVIVKAVEEGDISKERYDSYHRIIASMRENKPSYL